jgi:hypothetical protein
VTTVPVTSTSAAVRAPGALVVVDDFYDDPDAIRAFAVDTPYIEAWGSWEGVHSRARHPDTEALRRMAALVDPEREPNWAELDASYRFWRKASCGGFAGMLTGDRGVLHAHRRSGDWAGVVYLSRPEDCAGRPGTRFFRHAELGLERVEDAAAITEREERAIADCAHPERWVEVHDVPLAYNRLVLFDSRFFHAASDGFGDDVASCRLVQVFNFCLTGG